MGVFIAEIKVLCQYYIVIFDKPQGASYQSGELQKHRQCLYAMQRWPADVLFHLNLMEGMHNALLMLAVEECLLRSSCSLSQYVGMPLLCYLPLLLGLNVMATRS